MNNEAQDKNTTDLISVGSEIVSVTYVFVADAASICSIIL